VQRLVQQRHRQLVRQQGLLRVLHQPLAREREPQQGLVQVRALLLFCHRR
jgi:hypothetical protein